MQPELLSLFCGAGGLDDGFRKAGFKTILALDHCESAVRTFNENAKKPVAAVADLGTLTPTEFLRKVPPNSSPVGLIGGPPCQGFSRGNVRLDPHDPRNELPFSFARLLKAANKRFKLRFFLFENVTGLLSQTHKARFRNIITELESAGFNIYKGELNAEDFGVPQRRKRLFVVGLNRKIFQKLSFRFPLGGAPLKVVADVIKGLPPPKFYDKNLTVDDIPFHPNHWTMVPKSTKFQTVSCSHADGRSFRRLSWNELSPTVAYGHREIHVHPDGGRRLSVFEAMLLQGFSRDYVLRGTLSSQITQVCNAVPPPVAEAIARELKSLIEAKSEREVNHEIREEAPSRACP